MLINNENKGSLYVVGTPIGNLEDITIRAINTLKKVDIILAEDTRQTLKLLNHFDISKHMISYHRHNEDEKIKKIVEFLENGKDLALVSDAGMPIISDPGQNLVKYLVKNGYTVEVIPGVTALITALVKSGIDSTRFSFEGFLSVNKKQRKERLKGLENETRTMVFYEAPHKLLATLKDMYDTFGNRDICIAREITKLHEDFKYTNFEKAIEDIEQNGIRGEIVLIVSGLNKQELDIKNKESVENINSASLVKEYIKNGDTKKDAIKKVAKLKGVNKDVVYKECLEI